MVSFAVFDSPAKRKPEEDPEKARSDDSVHEEEKDQVGVAVFKVLHLFLVHLLMIATLCLVCLNGLRATEKMLEHVLAQGSMQFSTVRPEGSAGPATHAAP